MITDKLTQNYEAKNRFLVYIFITITFMFAIFSYVTYTYSKSNFYDNVDKILKNSAYAASFVLEKDFHDRALDSKSISEKEDKINIEKLSKYAQFSQIEYLYTMIKKDEKIYFTSSSATEEDFEKELVTRYFDEYESATEILMNSFNSDEIVFEESSDKWGTFRSVFIPMTSNNGNKYILGADIKINYIHKNLNNILFYFVSLFIVSLLIIYFFYTRKNYLEDAELENIKSVNEELEEEIKIKTLKLKNLNENLEKRVQKEVEKNLQQEKLLLKNSKYAAMGEMIDAVAHQWKQPLNVINVELGSTLKTIEYNFYDEKNCIRSLEVSLKQIEHLNTTINRFREFFSPNQNKLRVNVLNVINKSIYLLESVTKMKSVDIDVNSNDEVYALLIESEFVHVLINLINNSMDAFEENNIDKRNIDIDIFSKDEKTVITFQDNAGGIPNNVIDNIFKANYTTKESKKGSGVGLYLTLMIIQKIDGEIKVENSVGKHGYGALFTITI